MIAFLKGEIEELEETRVLLDVNGVGYGVFITGRDASALSGRHDNIKLYTYLQVREDAMQLYGFLRKDDLHVFRLLLGVNGIGPKAALGMLSVLSANDIRFAVLAGDAKAISLYIRLRAADFGLRSLKGSAEGFRVLGVTQMHCLPEAGD